MKLRIIKLTPETLAAVLQGKTSFASYLPSDLELLDAKMDLAAKQVQLVVRSDSFEDVAEAMPIPELPLSAKAEAQPAPLPKPVAGVLRVEPKLETSPSIVKPAPPPPSRYAAKMENEFSPDERKLLSFTVKDDSVIVKPVTFLKAEWDDINETVRSLGGRWVKGDIISYWEIPLQ
ncbi:MAG: hypothetical protein ACQCN6_07580 [Candidatus Bathyarchaeia archaeon]|jgi:hypothetical protein